MEALFRFAKPDFASAEQMACSKPRQNPFPFPTSLLKRKRSQTSIASVSPLLSSYEDFATAAVAEVNAPKNSELSTGAQATAPGLSSNAAATASPVTAPAQSAPQDVAQTDMQAAQSSAAPAALQRKTMTPAEREARARKVVESQINLEILLKHDELRQIEQELAKCQVALEQLRRCELIPFPGTTAAPPLTKQNVRAGTGPALKPAPGYSQPSHPAPWGVTDGPYTRHLAKWLLPDPMFDSVPEQTTSYGMDMRSSRTLATPIARAQRQSAGAKLQALNAANNNYALPKERHGPLTIKRQSDGQLVKLVCKTCGKEDTSSMQGFLNHCRIAHGRDYKTHNEAIIDCGVPLDSTDAVPAVPGATSTPVAAATSAVGTPVSSRPVLHPLITSNATAPSSSGAASLVGTPLSSASKPKTQPRLQHATVPSGLQQSPFKPSELTPNLSALFKRRGLGGDLAQLVTTAKEKCDINAIESLITEEPASGVSTPNKNAPGKPKNKNPVPSSFSASSTPAKPGSRALASAPALASSTKPAAPRLIPGSRRDTPFGFDGTASLASNGNRMGARMANRGTESPDDTAALSPRTVDSNPGMITDHGEDGDFEVRSELGDSFVASSERDNVRVRGDLDDDMPDACHSENEIKSIPRFIMQTPESATQGAGAEPPLKKRKRGRPSKKDKEMGL